MSVAAHLGIPLREYDHRIRTFIPNYEAMLDEAARALGSGVGTIVDLGVGTGALSARCKRYVPNARIIGIDADATCFLWLGAGLAATRDSSMETSCATNSHPEMPMWPPRAPPRAHATSEARVVHENSLGASQGRSAGDCRLSSVA
jgi:hypothetical protein